MYGFIKGTIDYIKNNQVCIDTGNVGIDPVAGTPKAGIKRPVVQLLAGLEGVDQGVTHAQFEPGNGFVGEADGSLQAVQLAEVFIGPDLFLEGEVEALLDLVVQLYGGTTSEFHILGKREGWHQQGQRQ